jgi:hypothetical protein
MLVVEVDVVDVSCFSDPSTAMWMSGLLSSVPGPSLRWDMNPNFVASTPEAPPRTARVRYFP